MPLPNELLIFVNQLRPEAYLTLENTRRFTSRFATLLTTSEGRELLDSGKVDPMPFVPNEAMHPMLSPYTVSAMNDYRVEWDAELGRRAHSPKSPSRMSAIYAFADTETCRIVNRQFGWPLETVRRFVVEDDLPYRAVRVNMAVISLLRTVYPMAMWSSEDLSAIWRHYWTGQGNLELQTPDLHGGQTWRPWSSGETWEWLIEGRLRSDDNSPVFT